MIRCCCCSAAGRLIRFVRCGASPVPGPAPRASHLPVSWAAWMVMYAWLYNNNYISRSQYRTCIFCGRTAESGMFFFPFLFFFPLPFLSSLFFPFVFASPLLLVHPHHQYQAIRRCQTCDTPTRHTQGCWMDGCEEVQLASRTS